MHRNRNRIVTAEKSQPISQKESLRTVWPRKRIADFDRKSSPGDGALSVPMKSKRSRACVLRKNSLPMTHKRSFPVLLFPNLFGFPGSLLCEEFLRSRWPATDRLRASGPKSGKKGPKNGLWPHRGTGGKNGRKMGKIARKWLKNGILGPFLPFFGHFSDRFPGEAMSHFSAIFARFRAEGPKAVCSRSTGS